MAAPTPVIAPASATVEAWLETPSGHVHWLDADAVTIGRSESNRVRVDAHGASRNHAIITRSADGCIVADLGSTNGTLVNGIRIERPTRLRDCDSLDFGGVAFTYRCRSNEDTPGATEQAATSVQIHSGVCWLLMLDLIGHTSHMRTVGVDVATTDFREWISCVRPKLHSVGATINAYLGDALVAYWRDGTVQQGQVARCIDEILQMQETFRRPFRAVLHYGPIRISGGLQGESLVGQDVIFLHRMEKAVKPFASRFVLSAPAAQAIGVPMRRLGQTTVPDYSGEHAFFEPERRTR